MIFFKEKLLMATTTQPLAFTLYNTVAQQVELAKLKVKEQTPVDDTASGLIILLLFTFLSIVAGFFSIIIKKIL